MNEVFLKLLNVSITASWLGIAVIIARLFLKKSPRWITVLLWALVAVRLICPVSIESSLSMIPSSETVPEEIVHTEIPQINSGIPYFNSAVNPVIEENFAPVPEKSVTPMEIITDVASYIWVIGVCLMLTYCAGSYIFVRYKVSEAAKVRENIWECDKATTPFVLGIIKPRIYVTAGMNETDLGYVISHERSHIKRFDHLWKPLGFLILSVYWFNPLLWVCYVLLCRDIEVACDEKVLRSIGEEAKSGYSTALINCSVPRKMITACPLAFGEVGVKDRVKNILNYKKPAFWLIIVGLIVCITVGVFFLTDPLGRETELDAALESFIKTELAEPSRENGEVFCAVDLNVLDVVRKGNITTVYAWVFTKSYTADGEGASASHIPSVITVKEKDGEFTLEEYWLPKDGNEYSDSIKKKFPRRLHKYALDSRDGKKSEEKCDAMAREYFLSLGNNLDRLHFLTANTELDGIKVSVVSSMLSGDDPFIVVEWTNLTDSSISFGEKFGLTYYDKGTWRDALKGDGIFHMTAREVKPGDTSRQVYYLTGYDLSHVSNYSQTSSVMYKFETAFRREVKDDKTEYKAWIYFDILDTSEIGGADEPSDIITEAKPRAARTYSFKGELEPFPYPQLTLALNKTFTFTYSVFSSYAGFGTYEETSDEVICRTYDGLNVWRFKKVDLSLVFDGKNSSPIPSFKYSQSSAPECPVPDGAVLEKVYLIPSGIDYYESCYCDIDSDGVIEKVSIDQSSVYFTDVGKRSMMFSVHSGETVEYLEDYDIEFGICSLTPDGNSVILEINRMHMSDMGPYLLKYRISVKNGNLQCEKISEEYLSIDQ